MPASLRRITAGLLGVLAIAAVLRGVWLTADPPADATLGIVWHDEGTWVHNARNRALWGHWRTDDWNPVFIAPVFTALEYGAFAAAGVGTWQARTVPVASGLVAVAALAAGLFIVAGRRTALIGAALLATNYVFVMWNRAALMESTMTAFIVTGWAAYAAAGRRPMWGLAAGAATTLAWFSKAAAAFFVAAMTFEALLTVLSYRSERLRRVLHVESPGPEAARGAVATLAGLALSGGIIAIVFVLPNWTEYQFYNWQVSVSRKPSYTLRAIVDRASWLPMVHDYFTRMWLIMVAAAVATIAFLTRSHSARPAERLLVLWLLVGLLELVVHDAGNERRYVMLIPALIGLAAIALAPPRAASPPDPAATTRRWIAFPIVALMAYLATGSLVRLAFLPDIRSGEFQAAVRVSAAIAFVVALAVVAKWRELAGWIARQTPPTGAVVLVVALAIVSDLGQYAQWAAKRTYFNHLASIEVGRLLPPATLVHGKLANGLALENRIRPVFVGRGFGNYADRTTRDDIRYVLTYTAPSLGYESQAAHPVVREILDAYPHWRIIATFEVRETEGGGDRAALIDKFGGGPRR